MAELTKEEFYEKWVPLLADNAFQDINGPRFDALLADMRDTFASVADQNAQPIAPAVNFDPVARLLTAYHVLGEEELEYTLNNGGFSPWDSILVDDLAHPQGEWRVRVRAAAGRNASQLSDSPKIDVKAAVTPAGPGTIKASMISDSTEAGRALLTAKDVAAQRVLLDQLNLEAGRYFPDQPKFDTFYGEEGALAYILKKVAGVAAPKPPINGHADDSADIFYGTVQQVNPALGDYEIYYPGSGGTVAATNGRADLAGTTLTIRGLAGNNPAGSVGMRRAASGNVPPSAWLTNAAAFTGTVVVTPPTTTLFVGLAIAVASITAGTPLTFTVTATGGTAPYVDYEVVATNTGTGMLSVLGTSASGSWTPSTPGTYDMEATVTDTAGTSKTSLKRTLTVTAVANQLPVANAGSDLAITLPTSAVQLMGSGTDADGPTPSPQWTQVTGPNTAVLATASLLNTAASGLVAGIYQFRLTVTDEKGGTRFDDVVVTVNAQPAPTITAISPGSGAVGSSVLVTGTGFGAAQGSSVLTVNGVQVASVASWSETTVRFTVPAGATTGKITLTMPAGTAMSTASFTVTARTSFTGPWLLNTIGDSRTYGTNSRFPADDTEASVITDRYSTKVVARLGSAFTGVTHGYPGADIVQINAQLDTALVKELADRKAAGTVVGGIASLFYSVNTFIHAHVDGIADKDAVLAKAKVDYRAAVDKALASYNAVIVWSTLPSAYYEDSTYYDNLFGQWVKDNYQSWGSNVYLMDCSLLNAVPGSAEMLDKIHPADALHTRIADRLYDLISLIMQTLGAGTTTPAPTALSITSFSPVKAPAGATVTVKGTHFLGAVSVALAGPAVDTFTVVDDTTITFVVPSSNVVGKIAVTLPGGVSVTSADTFTTTVAQGSNVLSISGFYPSMAPPGATVTVKGTHFTGAVAVALAGPAVDEYQVLNDTTIAFTVPAGTALGKISVILPGGVFVTSTDSFTTLAANTPQDPNKLSISSFSPTTAPTGATVTVKGTHFLGVVATTINGVDTRNVQVIDDTTYTFVVPATDKVGRITAIINGETDFFSSTAIFTGTDAQPGGGGGTGALSIASLSKTSASAGETITVKGTHFLGVVAVTFNGAALNSVNVVDDTTITFVVPASPGVGKITVVISASEYVTSADTFTVTA